MTTKKLLVLYSFLGIFIFSSYAQIGVGTQQGEWTLRWEENFDGSELNRDNWNIEIDNRGGGNYELQFYTARPENVRMGVHPETGESALILEARREEYGPGVSRRFFTSGRVNTFGNMAFQYGKLEIRARIPQTANGLWPALWLMGYNFPQVGWPRAGEIDVMEMGHFSAFAYDYPQIPSRNTNRSQRGRQAYYFSGHFHWGPAWTPQGWPNTGSSHVNTTSMQDDFTLWTMIWNRQEIRLYVDNFRDGEHPFARLNINPVALPYLTEQQRLMAAATYFHHPFAIIMNIAVGGRFTNIYRHNAGLEGVWRAGNAPSPELIGQTRITALSDENDNRERMYIDFVRVWQRGDAGERFMLAGVDQLPPTNINEIHTSQIFSIFPNPVVSELHVRGQEAPQSIAVFNILGTRVLEVQNTHLVDMSGLPAGNYILQITRTNGSTEIHRVSKAQ